MPAGPQKPSQTTLRRAKSKAVLRPQGPSKYVSMTTKLQAVGQSKHLRSVVNILMTLSETFGWVLEPC